MVHLNTKLGDNETTFYLIGSPRGEHHYGQLMNNHYLYAVQKDADYENNPEAYVIYEGKVRSSSTHKIRMARGGGFAISIREATPEDKKIKRLR